MSLSVVMSVYNETVIELSRSISSILEQTYRDFEFVIVVDNPNNREGIDFIKKIKDDRVRVLYNEKNMGLPKSLNRGIESCKSNYIARMDADDRSLPERFQIQMDYLKKSPEIDLIGSNKFIVDESNGKRYKNQDIPQKSSNVKKLIKYRSFMVHPTWIFKKDKFQQLGGYRNIQNVEDYDLLLRMIDQDMIVVNVDIPLIEYTVRLNSITKSNEYIQKLQSNFLSHVYAKKKIDNEKFVCNGLDRIKENFDVVEVSRYQCSRKYFEICKVYFNNKKYMKGTIQLIHTLNRSKQMRYDIFNYFKFFATMMYLRRFNKDNL